MRIRYPEGFVSDIDADLSLIGLPSSPLLRGTVTVHDALYSKRFEPNADLFSLTVGQARRSSGRRTSTTLPIRFDVQIDAPSSLRIENNLARMVASADLQLRGTYDQPLLFGSAQIERGRRHLRGQPLPRDARHHRVRQPGRASSRTSTSRPKRACAWSAGGRAERRVSRDARVHGHRIEDVDEPQLRSAALVGRHSAAAARPDSAQDLQNAELRTLNPAASTRSEEDLLKAATARLLTGSMSAPVNRAVEQTLGVDLQITPSIGSSETDPLTPSARRHRRQAAVEPRLRHVRASARHDAAARPRSSCSNTTRTIGSAGCSRKTAIAPSQSISACSTAGDDRADCVVLLSVSALSRAASLRLAVRSPQHVLRRRRRPRSRPLTCVHRHSAIVEVADSVSEGSPDRRSRRSAR